MNGLDTRRYEMLVRVRDFGTAHPHLFPPSTLGDQAFATVAAVVTQLSEHAATQLSGRGTAREGTTSKAVAREALREDLDAIIRTARAVALDMPGTDDKFRPELKKLYYDPSRYGTYLEQLGITYPTIRP